MPQLANSRETKLRLYGKDATGAFLYDTTFLHPFTSADFIQFNTNNTCVIGSDYYYYPNAPEEHAPPQKIPANTSTLNYTTIGLRFVLTSQSNLINPGGFATGDTVSNVDSHTLLFHSVVDSHAGGVINVSDAYYTK